MKACHHERRAATRCKLLAYCKFFSFTNDGNNDDHVDLNFSGLGKMQDVKWSGGKL